MLFRLGAFSPPLVVAEVRIGGTGGDNQRIELDRLAVVQNHAIEVDVEIDGFAEQHPRVLLAAQHGAQRRCNLTR